MKRGYDIDTKIGRPGRCEALALRCFRDKKSLVHEGGRRDGKRKIVIGVARIF